MLVGIGIAIAIKGKHFDPNIFAVRTDALKSTAAAVEGKAGTAPSAPSAPAATAVPETKPAGESSVSDKPVTGEESSAEGGGEGSAAPKPAVKGEPLEISLPGSKPMSDTEFYTADNLFEKIDGRAPAYQNYNVQGLRTRSFAINGGGGKFRGCLRVPLRQSD